MSDGVLCLDRECYPNMEMSSPDVGLKLKLRYGYDKCYFVLCILRNSLFGNVASANMIWFRVQSRTAAM